jgi:hypothetical protein
MSAGPTQSVFAPPIPEGVVRGPFRDIRQASSFGAENTTFGPSFSAREAIGCDRSRKLTYREAFYLCTNHDQKLFDWQGRANPRPGELSHQPLIGASLPTQYVPLDMRRPNDPYRLAKLIVASFTSMVFGEGMWPEIRVAGDELAQDFARELVRAQDLPSAMTRARNVGGSTGTVGLSWRFCNGLPRVAVHRPQFLHVIEWEDYERTIPAHVVKLTQAWRPVILRDGRRTQLLFWQRRDWTPEADVVFCEEPVDPKAEPFWRPDPAQTVEHGDGFCHFVWIRNLEETDETAIDGLPDYDALYENMGTLDILASVVTRGGILNLDPTLVIKADVNQVNRFGIRKGSDNAIVLDALTGSADAKYLELQGTSIGVGGTLIGTRRAHALEVAQCVVPNPDEVAAAGTTGVGLQRLYRPMLSQANLMRGAYGGGIARLLEQQLASARLLLSTSVAVPEDIEPEAPPESGEQPAVEGEEVESIDAPDESNSAPTLALAPRPVEEPDPGESGAIELEWPKYFEPTPDDEQKEISTLSIASGGKPVLSHRTAVEKAAKIVGADPKEEWRRVQEQELARSQGEQLMFPPAGGELPAEPIAPEAQAVEEGAEPGPAQVVQVSPEFVLNGAQIQAAVGIVEKVVAGDIPRDAGLGQLEILFNLPPGAALKIMGSAGMQDAASPSEPSPTPETAPSDVHSADLEEPMRSYAAAGGKATTRPDNPPAWVADEGTWERAKEAVRKYWDRYDEPWAVVSHVYSQMGGGSK